MQLITPPGVAGIAVLSAAPDERPAVVARLRRRDGGAFEVPAAGGPAVRARLCIGGRDVDDVLVVARPDGALELHLHGSPAVLEQLRIELPVEFGAAIPPAQRLLREALSVEQFELAVEQLDHDFGAALRQLLGEPVAARCDALLLALRRSEVARAHVEARRVVLVGQQNAGKSSLFNRLLFRERALTGALPGLTRDAIAERTTLAGYPYELVDTAGEGHVANELDAAAIAAGRGLRRGAVVVLVVDGSRGPSPGDVALAGTAQLVLRSKRDLPQAPWPDGVRLDADVSAERDAPADLRQRCGDLLRRVRGLPPAGPVGGFAALDADDHAALIAAHDDCSERPGSA